MLSSLSIRDIVLIDRLDLTFDQGLAALTGETGAGKSILLNALALACGDRADRGLVRNGADKAQAVAVFDLAESHPVWKILKDSDMELDPADGLVLRRTLSADGRSRAFINDQPCSVGLLRQLGDHLVEIHGQHDGRGLLDPGTHRGLLDNYAGHSDLLRKVTGAYKDLARAESQLEELTAIQARASSDRAFLEAAVEELDRLKPVVGEETRLADERKFLQQAEAALSELNKAGTIFQDSDGLISQLNASLRGLEQVRTSLAPSSDDDQTENASTRAHQAIDRATASLERALIEFNEAEDALSDAGSVFDVEPGGLDRIEERLFALRAAARKHNVSVDDLAETRDELAEQLESIDNADQRLKEAQAVLLAARTDYARQARALSESRQSAAETLAQAVVNELGPLKLDRARFQVRIETLEDRPGPAGWDKVAFEIATNPGSPFGPLERIASGGELSRFALAMKVALAEREAGKVMVFDEIDQGVGGAVADAVGHRLSRLAETGQAIVVTHSPQVAARSSMHWRIEKSVDDASARTHIRPLEEADRREEIARMLSGAEITDAARAAATELMAS